MRLSILLQIITHWSLKRLRELDFRLEDESVYEPESLERTRHLVEEVKGKADSAGEE